MALKSVNIWESYRQN